MDLSSPWMESTSASDGVYYVVRFPADWDVVAHKFRDYDDDPDHQYFWQEEVAPLLSVAWAARLKLRRRDLERKLSSLDLAFPRGRIEQLGLTYGHLHGNDCPFVSLDTIETKFGVAGKVRREVDEHEMCEAAHRAAMQKLLGLTETWPAL